MTYFGHDFFEHKWSVNAAGVVSVSKTPAGAAGTYEFVPHGLCVNVKYVEEHHVSSTLCLAGGVLSMVLVDSIGSRRTIHLSKENLNLSRVDDVPLGKFVLGVGQKVKKNKGWPSGAVFFGAFCLLATTDTKHHLLIDAALLCELWHVFFCFLLSVCVRENSMLWTEADLFCGAEMSLVLQNAFSHVVGLVRSWWEGA